jgi:C4-type Zn-finger protein
MEKSKDLPGFDVLDSSQVFEQWIGDAKDVMMRYQQCPICQSNLHFTHFTDFTKNMTQETARCPECSIRVRRLMHKLQ